MEVLKVRGSPGSPLEVQEVQEVHVGSPGSPGSHGSHGSPLCHLRQSSEIVPAEVQEVCCGIIQPQWIADGDC